MPREDRARTARRLQSRIPGRAERPGEPRVPHSRQAWPAWRLRRDRDGVRDPQSCTRGSQVARQTCGSWVRRGTNRRLVPAVRRNPAVLHADPGIPSQVVVQANQSPEALVENALSNPWTAGLAPHGRTVPCSTCRPRTWGRIHHPRTQDRASTPKKDCTPTTSIRVVTPTNRSRIPYPHDRGRIRPRTPS